MLKCVEHFIFKKHKLSIAVENRNCYTVMSHLGWCWVAPGRCLLDMPFFYASLLFLQHEVMLLLQDLCVCCSFLPGPVVGKFVSQQSCSWRGGPLSSGSSLTGPIVSFRSLFKCYILKMALFQIAHPYFQSSYFLPLLYFSPLHLYIFKLFICFLSASQGRIFVCLFTAVPMCLHAWDKMNIQKELINPMR